MSATLSAATDGSHGSLEFNGQEVVQFDERGIISGGNQKYRNDIINGQFRVAQTGTSFASPVSGSYDLDGWQTYNPSAALYTVSQVAGSSAGKFARQVTITTANASVAAANYVFDTTKIRGYEIVKYIGNTFVVAFRAKVPVAGIHCVALRNGWVDRSYIHEIDFPSANVWQDCSFIVSGGLPTSGTWNYTDGIGLFISFARMCGSNFQTTADTWNTGNFLATANQVNDCGTIGNIWAIENVTMNLGEIPFVDDASYDDDLRVCQQYRRPMTISGTLLSSTDTVVGAALQPPMNNTPTFVYTSGSLIVDMIGYPTAVAIADTLLTSANYIRVRFTHTAMGSVGLRTNAQGLLTALL